MAIGGCEVSYCFLDEGKKRIESKDHCFLKLVNQETRQLGYQGTSELANKNIMTDTDNRNNIIPDMTDMDEVRKAIIANEILNRKY